MGASGIPGFPVPAQQSCLSFTEFSVPRVTHHPNPPVPPFHLLPACLCFFNSWGAGGGAQAAAVAPLMGAGEGGRTPWGRASERNFIRGCQGSFGPFLWVKTERQRVRVRSWLRLQHQSCSWAGVTSHIPKHSDFIYKNKQTPTLARQKEEGHFKYAPNEKKTSWNKLPWQEAKAAGERVLLRGTSVAPQCVKIHDHLVASSPVPRHSRHVPNPPWGISHLSSSSN